LIPFGFILIWLSVDFMQEDCFIHIAYYNGHAIGRVSNLDWLLSLTSDLLAHSSASFSVSQTFETIAEVMYASFLHCVLQTAHQLFRFPTFYWSDETIFCCDVNLHPMYWVKVGIRAERGSGWFSCPSECFERNARLPVVGSSSETGNLCVRHTPPPPEMLLIYFTEQRSEVLLKYLMQSVLINPSKMWQCRSMWEQPKTLMMRLKANEIQELRATTKFILFVFPIASL
jgi:hypothetical protein